MEENPEETKTRYRFAYRPDQPCMPDPIRTYKDGPYTVKVYPPRYALDSILPRGISVKYIS